MMHKREWEKEYEEMVEASEARGEIVHKPDLEEKRDFPRFKLSVGSIWVKVDQAFDVVDVSVSGISFLSNYGFENGQVFALTLGKAFMMEANVVSCDLVETDADFMEARYHVRCFFNDRHSGIRFLVMLKELQDLEIGVAPPE